MKNFLIIGRKLMRAHSNKLKKYKILTAILSLSSLLTLSVPFVLHAQEASPTLTDEQFHQQMEDLFRQAMKQRESGNIYSSIEDFQSILSTQPKLHRARLEMAVAYYQIYKFDEAVKEAEIVLNDPETPPNVRVSILAFMAQVKQDAERLNQGQSTWKFPVEFGYVYDTNINIGPDSTVVVPGDEKQRDSGVMFSVGIDHTYQTGKRYNLGKNPANLLWQSGVNIYNKSYLNEDDYNLSVVSLRTGPTLVTTGSWRSNLTLQEDIISWGGEKYAIFSYLLPSYTWHFGDTGFESTADAVISRRDYSRPGYRGRDSVYLAPRLSVGYTFYNGKLAALTGIQYINENAKDDAYSQDAISFFLTGSWKFLEHNTLFAGYIQTESRYDAAPVPGLPDWGSPRDEINRQYKLGYIHTFKDFGWLTDWDFNAEVIHTSANSNLPAYDYSRSETTITLSRRF
jgi:hypothetical protein